MNQEIAKNLIEKVPYKLPPTCSSCGVEVRMLPEMNTVDMYAYKCGCTSPLGWSYTPNLKSLNPWEKFGRVLNNPPLTK